MEMEMEMCIYVRVRVRACARACVSLLPNLSLQRVRAGRRGLLNKNWHDALFNAGTAETAESVDCDLLIQAFHPVHGTFATCGSDGKFVFWDKDRYVRRCNDF